MRVSVFLPYFNDKIFLRQSIESVLGQTIEDFELILVNHASTDGSRDLARGYVDCRIKHIDMPKNYGAGTGLNLKAFLTIATGTFVKFMCADDVLLPDALERMVSLAEKDEMVDVVFGNCQLADEALKVKDDDLFSVCKRRWPESAMYEGVGNNSEFLRMIAHGHCLLPYPGAMVKRTLLNQISIDASLIMLYDVALWVACMLKGCKMRFESNPVCLYRVHSGQTSSLARMKTILNSIDYEKEAIVRMFAQNLDLDLTRRVFAGSAYVTKCETIDDARFIVYEWFLRFRKSHLAYVELATMLNDEVKREWLEKKFSFNVYSLRSLYMGWDAHPQQKGFKQWKMTVRNSAGRELSVMGLLWLLVDRIWKVMSFYEFRRKG